MSFTLPRTLALPSGKRVTLRSARAKSPATKRLPYLFADAIELFETSVEIVEDGAPLDVRDLPLADFHVARAVVIKAGLVPEEEASFDCHNCGHALRAQPTQTLETGPWEDDEAHDPELDTTAPFDEPLEIRPIRLGRVRQIRTVTLAPRTVRDALPLFAALGKSEWQPDAEVVRAMGITALGTSTDAAAIAKTLADHDDALDAVTDVFIEAHYPLRLSADVFCSECKARNRVDVPFVREFEHTTAFESPHATDNHRPLPPLDEFVERAHAIAEPLIADIPGGAVEFVVESGTPDVDDGGEPLLGSYVPPPPKDAPVPARPGKVTVYYRTFQRIEAEEGAFDWEDELAETIEHELEHHIYWLRGDDPMDAEEHAEIDREVARVIGRSESTRRTLAVFGQSFSEFFTRAWPLIAIAALAFGIWLAGSQCGTGTPE